MICSLGHKTPNCNSLTTKLQIRDSLMVRMGACRVPDRGSIPRRGDISFLAESFLDKYNYIFN
ncbi:uncharacterized protein RNJ42_02756 [Nakaseomyces bracarensis]|uniref:uncharacterized protein n=1 Tax=Nakaseomyces bracarensis TaxID=273131 RepID=UPI003871E05D